jgi:chromosome segregation ATPase
MVLHDARDVPTIFEGYFASGSQTDTLHGAMPPRSKTVRSATKVPSVSQLPVTRAMLYNVRDELAARIDQTNARIDQTNAELRGVRDELNARIDQTNARIDQTNAELRGVRDELNARIDQTNARIDQTNAELRSFKEEIRHEFERFRAEIRTSVARIQTLVEEQEARNRVVLEVVQGHNARFDRIEAEIRELKELFREVLAALARCST